MKTNNSHKQKGEDIETVRRSLEKRVELAVWIPAVGQALEATSLSQLLTLEDERGQNEQDVVTGVWVQTIGQFIEAIGVSQELSTDIQALIFQGQQLAITGNALSSAGAALEAIASKRILIDEIQSGTTKFIP